MTFIIICGTNNDEQTCFCKMLFVLNHRKLAQNCATVLPTSLSISCCCGPLLAAFVAPSVINALIVYDTHVGAVYEITHSLFRCRSLEGNQSTNTKSDFIASYGTDFPILA
eukprot:4025274-Amphidinium_carterae.1